MLTMKITLLEQMLVAVAVILPMSGAGLLKFDLWSWSRSAIENNHLDCVALS